MMEDDDRHELPAEDSRTPLWVRVCVALAILLVLVIVIVHLAGGGLHDHMGATSQSRSRFT